MQIEAERLIIRPFTIDDLAEFKKLLSIPEVPGWHRHKYRAGEFLAWHISNYSKMDIVNGIVCFGIFNKASDLVIGAVGAGEHDDLHEPEIFFNILPVERRKGYAVEAARAITDWVFTTYQIPYLIGTAGISNVASQKVLEHCGYQYIDEQTLQVHIENTQYRFRYYRNYQTNAERKV